MVVNRRPLHQMRATLLRHADLGPTMPAAFAVETPYASNAMGQPAGTDDFGQILLGQFTRSPISAGAARLAFNLPYARSVSTSEKSPEPGFAVMVGIPLTPEEGLEKASGACLSLGWRRFARVIGCQ